MSINHVLLDETAPLSALLELAAGADTRPEHAWQALQAVAARSDDTRVIQRAAKVAGKLPPRGARRVRLALVGGYTTSFLPPVLTFYLQLLGVQAEFYDAPFGQIAQTALQPPAELRAFQPDFALILPSHRDTRIWQCDHPTPADLQADIDLYRRLWDRLKEMGIQPVQHNVTMPAENPLGNFGGISSRGGVRWLHEFNRELAEAANGNATVLDVNQVACTFGLAAWHDDRLWHMTKQAFAMAALPVVCRAQANQLRALLGLSAKVLALDLDNTLWGGVIGEDGLAGIELNGTAAGEAYRSFQAYCRGLKERGVLLAVVSKNNDEDARLPFDQHPEMLLKEGDIAAFRANWQPKSENLRSIADELSLGLDSFLFFDDNPAERAEVRAHLPQVQVVDVPEDPSLYVRALHRTGAFEIVSLTEEDQLRAADYAGRRHATELQAQSESLESFLSALAMCATVSSFQEVDLPRIVQLIQKTNQFNLTTRRYTEADVRERMADARYSTLTVRLADQFGDRGLVGILITCRQGDDEVIDTWLMSCRVLGRTVEEFMLRQIVARRGDGGARRLVGTYVPTAKNALVRDLYPRLDFTLLDEKDDGSTVWALPLDPGPTLPPTYVALAEG